MKVSAARSLIGIICLLLAHSCLAREILFYKVSRTYGREGPEGGKFQRQFEARMFPHANWHQRLYISPYDPPIDDTLEIFSKPDGSRWLSHYRATPSLARLIEPAPSGEQYDIRKEIAALRVSTHEIPLPTELAKEIEILWRTMLPGLSDEPRIRSTTHVLYVHAPAFIAFSRSNNAVEAGRIATAAYDSSAYKAFLTIVDDLINVCDRGGSSTDPILLRLPSKVRALRVRL